MVRPKIGFGITSVGTPMRRLVGCVGGFECFVDEVKEFLFWRESGLFDRWELGVGVAGDGHRRGGMVQAVADGAVVLPSTQEQADGRGVVRLAGGSLITAT
jgi:hypothetical protein